jgi:hypothetical protein
MWNFVSGSVSLDRTIRVWFQVVHYFVTAFCGGELDWIVIYAQPGSLGSKGLELSRAVTKWHIRILSLSILP